MRDQVFRDLYGHRTFGTHSRFDRRPRGAIEDAIAACAR
jgi:hypothetical protein